MLLSHPVITAGTYKACIFPFALSTLITLGYMPAQRAALTTAQFSELLLRSLISPPPLALTNPEALNWPSSCVLRNIGKI